MSDTTGSLSERDRDEDVDRGAGVAWVDDTEATIQRYLPYVVGVIFALGLLVFGGVQACRPTGKATDLAAEATGSAANTALASRVKASELIGGFSLPQLSTDAGVVTLKGTVDTEADKVRAGELAAGVAGVSRVDNRLSVAGGSGPTVLATATADVGTIVLTGEVPSEAVRKDLVAAAAKTYGAAGVTDRLTVNGAAGGYDLRVVGTVPASLAASLRGDLGTLGTNGKVDDQLALTASTPTTAAAATAAPTTAAPTTIRIPVTTPAPDTSAAPVTTVAPAPTTAPAPSLVDQLNAVVKAAPVLFDVELATLRPESIPTLDRVAQIMLSRPDGRFEVQGHTDPRGGEAVNLPLSQERSDAVAQYLISKGVPAARLVAKGYGSSRPVATNDTDEGKQLNRRIEFAAI